VEGSGLGIYYGIISGVYGRTEENQRHPEIANFRNESWKRDNP
jgi:hypothetical protein